MEQLDVKILDRDFRLAVTDEEKPSLLEAVQLVDEKMRSVRDSGKLQNLDRIAVMAALQLAHELISARGKTSGSGGAVPQQSDLIRKIQRMNAELDEEIKRQESLF